MKLARIIFLFSICSAYVYSNEQDSLVAQTTPDSLQSSRTFLTLVYDPGMTERAGIEDVLTIHFGISQAEDTFLGKSWFSENTLTGKVGGILARSLKYGLLDFPVDYLSQIFVHEYFGHGMRCRELTNNDIQLHLGTPPPYGDGGGYAHAINRVPLSTHEELAVEEGGIEAQALLNRAIALRWMATNKIGYRDAALYLLSFESNYTYINNMKENIPFNQSSGDPDAYLRMLNIHAGINDWNNAKMSVGTFKSQMKLNMLNPFFFYSLYYFTKTYLLDGNSSSEFPTFCIADFRYLPVFRVGMTPFGTENHLENYLKFRETTVLVDIRFGDQTFYTSWGGIGLAFLNLASNGRFTTDLNVDVWKQPELILGGNGISSGRTTGTPQGGGLGGAVSMREYFNLSDSKNSLSMVFELGYKSIGFLEGYNLGSSLVSMIGIGYHFF